MKCCRQKFSMCGNEMDLPQIIVCLLFNETLVDNLPISALLFEWEYISTIRYINRLKKKKKKKNRWVNDQSKQTYALMKKYKQVSDSRQYTKDKGLDQTIWMRSDLKSSKQSTGTSQESSCVLPVDSHNCPLDQIKYFTHRVHAVRERRQFLMCQHVNGETLDTWWALCALLLGQQWNSSRTAQ